MFKWAINKNYITKNPGRKVERFRVEKKNPRFFSRDEIRLILDDCSAQSYPIYMILLHTGMRKGELTHLEWADLDFSRMVIKIRPKEKDGWTPKNKKEREIPINDELLPVLLKLKAGSKGRCVVEKTNDKPYNRCRRLSLNPPAVSGHNSAVECQLPKLGVAGSNPVARSFYPLLRVFRD